jgi:hypothetical protein
MILFVTTASAFAADLAAFTGEWVVDPTKSDDAITAVTGAPPATLLSGGDAAGLAPDQQGEGEEGVEKARDDMVTEVMGLLGSSGRMGLRPDGEALAVTFAGESPLLLEPDGAWARAECQDAKCRVRLIEYGDRLVLERRRRSTKVRETLMTPDVDGLMVSVVHVEAVAADRPIEFRRVYRALRP